MDPAEFAGIPGIDLEPLDPFYDDVFAGMDEHPTGPWPHQLLAPAELHEQQQLHSHFPAIDCVLLEEQAHAAAEPAAVQCEQHHSWEQAVSVLPVPETAQVQQHQPEQPGSSAQGPGHLNTLVASTGVTAAPAAPDQDDAGPVPTHMAPSAGSMHASYHEAPADATTAPADALCAPISSTSSSAHAEMQQSAHAMAVEQPQWDASQAGCASQQEDHTSSSQNHSSSSQDAAGAPSQDHTQAHRAVTGHALDSSSAAAVVGLGESFGSTAAVGTDPEVDEVTNSAAGVACVAGKLAPSSATSEQAGGMAAAGSMAAAATAGPDGEASSGSLPDIDDVPEEQVDSQQQQQAAAEIQQRPLLYWDEAEQEQEQEQQPHSKLEAQEHATPELQGSTGVQPPKPNAAHISSRGSSSMDHAAAALEPLAAEQHLVSSSAPATDAELTAAGAVPAAAGHADQHTVLGDVEQQQMSAHADMFASPCSSWHSCITAGSKASSMNNSRAFFLQHPAAGTAAIASTVSSTQQGTSVHCGQDSQQQQPSEVQQPSMTGVSSPAMVSNLHLALQQHEQQQRQSQHSHQSAQSGAAEEAATTAAVEQPGMDNTLCPAHAQQEGAAEHAFAAAACSSSSTQPIAVQQQHPHKDELWQDVSPPSFSSSLGVLVSAVSAGTPAAVAAAAADEESQQGTDPTAAAAAAAAAADAAEASGEASEHQDGEDVFADDDVGHGHFYAEATGLSMSPEQHSSFLQRPGLGHPQYQQQHLANSSYVLRHSELVELSLSTSVHPGLLQQQQQVHPGWLTAHQQLPPAAAQAVERAVVALNDSYYSPGRNSPSEVLGSAAAGPAGSGVGGARGMGVAAMGAVGGAIRRSGAGRQWNRAHTHPQQDQQARHSLPSQAPHSGPAGPFSWPGAAVLGDWFSSTVQHPLAAAASRAAVGVVQRMGMAPAAHAQQQQAAGMRQHGSGSSRMGAVSPHAAAGSSFTGGSSGNSSGVSGAPNMGPVPVHGPSVLPAAVPGTAGAAVTAAALGGEPGMEDDFSPDDAVLIEKTSDLPQSLQEQEDEAFRGLLFLGGRDSQGRPVVIVNTDAIPAGHNSAPRDAALAYLLKRLSPIVTRGPYVLVVVALHSGPQFRLLPGVWCVRAYQSLPRAFRKNVKHVILLQPSMLVKAAVTLLYPFVSSKAHAKVKQVQRLLDVDAATCGEVQVPHLGEAFLTTVHHINGSRAREADS